MKTKQTLLWACVVSVATLLMSIGCAKHKTPPAPAENPDLMTQLKSIHVENTASTNKVATMNIDIHEIRHADLVGFIDAFLHTNTTYQDALKEGSISSIAEFLAQVAEELFSAAVIGFEGDDLGNGLNPYDNAGIAHNAICQAVMTNKNSWYSNNSVNWVSLRGATENACRAYYNDPLYSIDPGTFTYYSTNFLSSNPNAAQQCETLLSNAVNLNQLSQMDHDVMNLYLSQIDTYQDNANMCTYSIAYENTVLASQDPNLHKNFLLSCFSIVRHSSCLWTNVRITN
jgi:hypothetical protein